MGAYLGAIQGDDAYARRQFLRAAEVLRGCEDGLVVGYHAFAAGSMHLFQGDMEGALREVTRSIDLFRAVDHVNHVPTALRILAMCHEALGDREAASRAKVECLALTEAGQVRGTPVPCCCGLLGHEALALGNDEQAIGLFIRALVMKSALRDVPGVALVLEGLAGAEVRRGHASRAARLLGAAEATWRFEMDPLAAPFAAHWREAARADVVAVLGEQTAASVAATGRVMAIDDAIAYAMISASGRRSAQANGGDSRRPRSPGSWQPA